MRRTYQSLKQRLATFWITVSRQPDAAACEGRAGSCRISPCGGKGIASMGAIGRSYHEDRTSSTSPKEILGTTENLRLSLISDPPGIVEFLGSPHVFLSLHV